MMVVNRKSVIYQFGPDNRPVAKVKPGEAFIVETDDCFKSQIKSETDLVTSIDFSRINPATGPVEVEGAQPGDILVVGIMNIEVGDTGFMVTIPDRGAFGKRIRKPLTKVVPIEKGMFRFNSTLSFPVRPMIGVIGVSPGDRFVPCGEIGDHGGNMDAKVIRDGAKVYFKVLQEGAMVAMGDVHAGMGDGEAVICGVEVISRIEVRVDLLHSPAFVPSRPVVELGDSFITIGHGLTLDDAAQTALDDMLTLIQYKTAMKSEEIAMLISAVGDLRVCQVVDPQKTARVEMPKSILPEPRRPIFY